MKVFKCCYNCENGTTFANSTNPDVQKKVEKFNASRRICIDNNRQPEYLMYERRYCKGFEPSRLLPMRNLPYYEPPKE